MAALGDVPAESMERLKLMKSELDVNNRALQSQVVELLRSSCPQLVENAKSVREMAELAYSSQAHIESAAHSLPLLSAEIDQLLGATQQAIDRRERNMALLRQQAPLLELFEVPSLMDTCIRSGLIDEALELRATMHAIVVAHPDVPLLGRIAAELNGSASLLQENLTATLHSAASLPAALTAVGHLRRMGALDEAELRATFLHGCTQRLLAETVKALREQAEPYRQCLRLLQLSRERWFDTVTHYSAIFGSSNSNAARTGTGAGAAAVSLELSGWVASRAAELVQSLSVLLPQVGDSGLLSNVLEQAISASASLARVGAELGGLLLPLFEAAICRSFAQALGLAERQWAAALAELARKAALPGGRAKPLAESECLAAAAASGADRTMAADGQPPSLAPPRCLLRWDPLAYLANSLVAALSELRKCALLSLQPAVRAALAASLGRCVAALEGLGGRQRQFAEAVAAISDLFAESLLPFVDTLFSVVFGAQPPQPSRLPTATAGGVAAAPAGAAHAYRAGQLTRLLRPRLLALSAHAPTGISAAVPAASAAEPAAAAVASAHLQSAGAPAALSGSAGLEEDAAAGKGALG